MASKKEYYVRVKMKGSKSPMVSSLMHKAQAEKRFRAECRRASEGDSIMLLRRMGGPIPSASIEAEHKA